MIVEALYRQSLIAERNNLIYSMLQNSAYQRSALKGGYSFDFLGSLDKSLELENDINSTQLMAINAELKALDDAKTNSKMNYLA